MKSLFLNYLAVTVIVLSTVMTGCNNENPEPDDVFTSSEYMGIIGFGEQFDFTILGKDGLGYFYDFQNENPIPERLSIYDLNKREVKMMFKFDEEGLPKSILSKDFAIVLGNFIDNRFDAVVITNDGESHILENLETNISWNEYKNDLLSDVRSSTIVTRGLFGKWINKTIIKPALKVVNTVSSAVACGVGIGISTTGVGAIVGVPLAAYGCTNLVFNSLELLDDLDVIDFESPEIVEVIRNNGGDMFQNCATMVLTGGAWGGAGCVISGGTAIINGLESIEDSKKEDIKKGEEILISNDPNFWKPQKGDVYVAGISNGKAYGESDPYDDLVIDKAVVWKNGVAQILQTDVNYSFASSVYVDGGDVYVAGYEENMGVSNSVAIIWKNGVAQYLTDTDGKRVSSVNSVFVSNGDVYALGWSNGRAVICKNGVVVHSFLNNESVQSIFVSGSDVYVSGNVRNSQGFDFITLWKNGVAQHLTDGNSFGYTNSVFVSGSDVYVAGLQYNEGYYNAILWKNGVLEFKDFSAERKIFNSVYVLGNNVYIAGSRFPSTGGSFAVLWKNGEAHLLTEEIQARPESARANSVFVSGNDVYVAGSISHTPILWKNRVPYSLPYLGNGQAESVFVVE